MSASPAKQGKVEPRTLGHPSLATRQGRGALGSEAPEMANYSNIFTGDFELLPIRAHFDYPPVSSHPTSNDFHMAVTRLRGSEDDSGGYLTWNVAAGRYVVELIRARRTRSEPVAANDRAVMSETARLLAEWVRSA